MTRRTLALCASLALALIQPARSASAAEADPAARFDRALKIERGLVDAGMEEAVALYCQAAAADHAGAAFSLGWLHFTGRGVRMERKLAAAWFAKAASLGHREAGRLASRMPKVAKALATCDGGALARAEMEPPQRLLDLIGRMAPDHGLEPELVLAVVAIESGFRHDAVSPRDARGLMQLTGDTADRFGVADPFDVRQNLKGGMRYLNWLLRTFDGDVTLTLAAYNAGEGAVRRHGGVPPYAETRAYLEKVRRYYRKDHHPVASVPPHRQRPRQPAGTQTAETVAAP